MSTTKIETYEIETADEQRACTARAWSLLLRLRPLGSAADTSTDSVGYLIHCMAGDERAAFMRMTDAVAASYLVSELSR